MDEHVSFTDVELVPPLDNELSHITFFLIKVLLGAVFRNLKQIYTENAVVLVRKDIEVIVVENNVLDVRNLAGLIDVYLNFGLRVHIEGVLWRSDYRNGLFLVEHEEFRLFGKIRLVVIARCHVIFYEIIGQNLLLSEQNDLMVVIVIEADPLARSRHVFGQHIDL